MLSDGLELLGTSTASNFSIDSGSILPTIAPLNVGELFYYVGHGLMVYSGTAWEAIGGGGTSGDFQQQFDAAISIASVNELSDIQTEYTNESNQIVGPRDGEVLAWSAAIGQWVPSDASVNVSSVNQLLGAVVLTTSEIPEPNVQNPPNQYWNAARGDAYLALTSIKKLKDVNDVMSPSPNDILKWDGSQWTSGLNSQSPIQTVNGQVGTVVLTTSDVSEGSRLYYTQLRFDTAFALKHLGDLFDVALGSSPNGKYLMYSQEIDESGQPVGLGTWVTATAPGAPVTSVNGKAGVVRLTSDDLTQGSTNLFFDPATFASYFGPAFTTSFAASHLTDLSELTGAVTGQFMVKTSNGWSTAVPPTALVTSVAGKNGAIILNPSDIIENGTGQTSDKIWFSTDRFDSHFAAKHLGDIGDVHLTNQQVLDTILWDGSKWYNATIPSSSVISVAGRTGTIVLTTDDVPEGGNQYWTQARFNTAYNSAYTGSLTALKLSSLFDVAAYGIGNVGQYLAAFNKGDGTVQWRPTAPPTAPVTSVAGKIGAVTLTTDDVPQGSTNQYSSQASVTAYVGTLSIDAFNDVAIGTPSTGQVLKWNGVQWTNDVVSVSSAAVISGLGFTPANIAGAAFTGAISSTGNVSGAQLVATTANGATPALVIPNTTQITNLNASLLGGQASTYYSNEYMTFAITDEVTTPTTGTNKITFRAPYPMTLYQIPRLSCSTAGSGVTTVDILLNGTSILGASKLSIDASEKTSVSAAVATTLAVTSIPDDGEITVSITGVGASVLGLKITLYVRKT